MSIKSCLTDWLLLIGLNGFRVELFDVVKISMLSKRIGPESLPIGLFRHYKLRRRWWGCRCVQVDDQAPDSKLSIKRTL